MRSRKHFSLGGPVLEVLLLVRPSSWLSLNLQLLRICRFALTFMKPWFCCQPLPVPTHHGKRFSLRCFSKSTHISSENLSLSLTHIALISHSSAVNWVLTSIKMNIRIYWVEGLPGAGRGECCLLPPTILSCLLFRELGRVPVWHPQLLLWGNCPLWAWAGN